MKSLNFIFLSLFFLLVCSEVAFTVPTCDAPPKTTAEAKECAEMLITSKTDVLYEYAETKGHLGNIEVCTSTSNRKSYFTDNYADFGTMAAANVRDCAESNQDSDAFQCWIQDGPPACYIRKGSTGELSTVACMRLGKSSGKLITLFPYECD